MVTNSIGFIFKNLSPHKSKFWGSSCQARLRDWH